MIPFKEDDIMSEVVVHYDPEGSDKVRVYDLTVPGPLASINSKALAPFQRC
jgi:hypothetical protein